jgi:hypothetical protein
MLKIKKSSDVSHAETAENAEDSIFDPAGDTARSKGVLIGIPVSGIPIKKL